MPEAFLLIGKLALVTGGGSGIGEATCRELSRAGAEVLVADVNLAAAEKVASSLPAAKGFIHGCDRPCFHRKGRSGTDSPRHTD